MKPSNHIFDLKIKIKESHASLLSARGRLILGVLLVVFGLLALTLSEMISAEAWWIHGVWCIFGMLITIPALVKAFKAGFEILLHNHFVMFTIAFTLYFLFGAAFLALGPEGVISNLLIYYPATASDALWANAENSIGFGVALITGAISSGSFLARQADKIAVKVYKVPVLTVIIIFIVIGTIAKFYVLDFDLRFSEGVVSGLLRSVSDVLLIAILLASSFRGKYGRLMLVVSIVLTLIGVITGFLLFSKTSILLSVGVLVAGLTLRYKSKKVMLLGLFAMILLFINVIDIVGYSRNNLSSEIAGIFTSRSNVVKDGYLSQETPDSSGGFSSWSRLCYVPSQNAARNFYDTGIGGEDIKLIPWVFIPRFLAPNKPVMTDAGVDFHIKISGNKGSSTGQGVFSSGYYNLGWLGVVFASILCGWILSQTSSIAYVILSRQAHLLLPFAFFGVFIAFRIDGHFLADYLGAFMLIFYSIMILSAILSYSNSSNLRKMKW